MELDRDWGMTKQDIQSKLVLLSNGNHCGGRGLANCQMTLVKVLNRCLVCCVGVIY